MARQAPKKRIQRFKLHKFVVQAVLVRHDDSGEPIAENPSNPIELFSLNQLRKYADDFPGFLAETNKQALEMEQNGNPE